MSFALRDRYVWRQLCWLNVLLMDRHYAVYAGSVGYATVHSVMPFGDATPGARGPDQISHVLPRLSTQQLGSTQRTKLYHGQSGAASLALDPSEHELQEVPHKLASQLLTARGKPAAKASARGNRLVTDQSSALPALLPPSHGAKPGIPALHTFLVAQAEEAHQEAATPTAQLQGLGSLTAESRLKSLPNYAKPQNRTPLWSERERRARNVAPANPYKQKLDLAAKIKPASDIVSPRTSTNTSVEVAPGRFRVAPLGLSKQPTGQQPDLLHLGPLTLPGKLNKASLCQLQCLCQ